jgi:hypothetical protein
MRKPADRKGHVYRPREGTNMSSWLGFIVLSGSIIFGSIGHLIGRPKGRGLGFWPPRRTGRSCDMRSHALSEYVEGGQRMLVT